MNKTNENKTEPISAPDWLCKGDYPAFLPTGLFDPRDPASNDVAVPPIVQPKRRAR